MNEKTAENLFQLLHPLQALARSVERAIVTETFEGTGDLAVRTYRGLHARVAALLPDDDYITEALALDVPPEASERQKVAQVQLAVSQLVTYLESQLHAESHRYERCGPRGMHRRHFRRRHMGRGHHLFDSDELDELKDMGQELRDRIVSQTKDAIRRAMSSFDIEVDDDEMPGGPRKRRVTIRRSDGEDADFDVTMDVDIGEDIPGEDVADDDPETTYL